MVADSPRASVNRSSSGMVGPIGLFDEQAVAERRHNARIQSRMHEQLAKVVPDAEEVTAWLSALERRHLSELRVPEVTRALRALSSAYVERRQKVAEGATMDSAGKRAAFALFYGPLHFLIVRLVLAALHASQVPGTILDLGCGTGVAGAAWASAWTGPKPSIVGIDRHPWAVEEAKWTYRHFGLQAQVRRGALDRLPSLDAGSGIVAGWVLNELSEDRRVTLERAILRAGQDGVSVLVLEPLSRAATPWWKETAARVCEIGGRADEWRFPIELPPLQRLLDRAAGLRHHELLARTLSMNL
jgi:hypothetical protein